MSEQTALAATRERITLRSFQNIDAAFHGRHNLLPLDDLLGDEEPGEDKPFGSADAEKVAGPVVKALNHVRDLLSITDAKPPSRRDSAIETPVFFGHGDADEKIRPSLGGEAYQTMKAVGFQADWKSYEDQAHWYKVPGEVDDIVEFVRTRVGWPLRNESGDAMEKPASLGC